jgi:hypothetical protein
MKLQVELTKLGLEAGFPRPVCTVVLLPTKEEGVLGGGLTLQLDSRESINLFRTALGEIFDVEISLARCLHDPPLDRRRILRRRRPVPRTIPG